MTSDAFAPGSGEVSVPFPLQASERVLLLCRRHWFYLWPRTVLLVGIALIPVALVEWGVTRIGSATSGAGGFASLLALLWILYWAFRAFMNWYAYHNDIWVVTNQRLVDVTKPTPWRKRLATADLVNIQDMTVEQRGIFATVLGFGDVVCQTAGRDIEFRLAGVPKPAEVQLFVDKERDRERGRSGGARL
jgi:hypothetical protein